MADRYNACPPLHPAFAKGGLGNASSSDDRDDDALQPPRAGPSPGRRRGARQRATGYLVGDGARTAHERPRLGRGAAGVFSCAYLSHTLWHLGFADQAVTKVTEAIVLARELSHPFSEVLALDYAAMLHQFRGEPDLAHGRAEAARVMCEEQGFEYYRVWVLIIQGWVLTHGAGPTEA